MQKIAISPWKRQQHVLKRPIDIINGFVRTHEPENLFSKVLILEWTWSTTLLSSMKRVHYVLISFSISNTSGSIFQAWMLYKLASLGIGSIRYFPIISEAPDSSILCKVTTFSRATLVQYFSKLMSPLTLFDSFSTPNCQDKVVYIDSLHWEFSRSSPVSGACIVSYAE
jgi:hypothetical protein